MIDLRENKELIVGQVIQVYRNLNNGLFSIRDKKTRLVLAHGDNILIKDAVFNVGEKSRQRVLKERVKNVHAYVEGKYVGTSISYDTMNEVYYNPYTTEFFINKKTNQNVFNSEEVFFKDGKAYILGGI